MQERDLGVRITSDLKASAQCAYVCARANRVLGMIIDLQQKNGVQKS